MLKVIAIITGLVLGITIASAARAHEWYPWECCSSTDCEPLAEEKIRITSEGYHLPNGELVRHGDTRPSKDGQYHWCRKLTEPRPLIRQGKACLFVPEGGA